MDTTPVTEEKPAPKSIEELKENIKNIRHEISYLRRLRRFDEADSLEPDLIAARFALKEAKDGHK